MKKLKAQAVLLLVTVLLWSTKTETFRIHDGSLYLIHEISGLGVALCVACWIAIIFSGIVGLFRRNGQTDDEPVSDDITSLPDATAGLPTSESPKSYAATRSSRRYYAIVGIAAAIAFLVYFPSARYIQVLAPGRFWMAVFGLSVAGGALIHLSYTRHMLACIDRLRDRILTILLPLLLLIPCVAITVRLLNTPLGLLRPPSPDGGRVVGKSTSGGLGYDRRWTRFSVVVRLDSGRSVSVDLSKSLFNRLKVRTAVQMQIRAGLLGMPWCLGECVSPLTATNADSSFSSGPQPRKGAW